MDVTYNAVNRLMHQEHFTRVYRSASPGGPPCSDHPIRNFRPNTTVGIVDAHSYGIADRERFLPSSNNAVLVDRNECSVDEGQTFLDGGSHVSSVVNTSPRMLDWPGTTQTGEMGEEVEYRGMEERDGGSSGRSQSDGSEEDEEEDGDIEGEGEDIESHQGVISMVDRGMPHRRGYEAHPSIQMDGIDGNRHEVMAGMQSSEGFQKSNFNRESSSQASASSTPSLGMFLSQASTIPFLNSFSSPPSIGPMLGHGGSGSTPQNESLAASELGTSPGYYRDSIGKEISARETFVKDTQNYNQEPQGISRASPVPEAEPVGTASTEHYSALVPLKDAENQIVAFSQRKNHNNLKLPLRAALTDPLTGALMDDATILFCGHSFGSESLQRVIENNACISCGAAAKREDMAPNHVLQSVVQAYKLEEERWKVNTSKATKRKRGKHDHRQNSGDLTMVEFSRLKGVKFPYKVNDNVLIKGNKRTPERFVGCTAVITTQCLNGWYVVRTLDNGESVKLQYRSLTKADEQPSKENEANITGPNWL